MAKLFYTIDEAAEKLGTTTEEIQAMVESGKLQEFRDRDRLMFKRDQVDLLASSGDDDVMGGSGTGGMGGSGGIPLAESGELGSISLASDSGTGIPLESPKEQTGISIFEADATEEADPSAVTQITETSPAELQLETMGSGSGLLDLTREADDTSLGQNLLEEQATMSATEGSGMTAADDQPSLEGSGAGMEAGPLFESTGAEAETAAPALVAAMAEPFDGPFSGFTGGAALGMTLVLAAAIITAIFGMMGAPNPLAEMMRSNFMMWAGILAGVVFLPAIIGLFVGKRG
jgi:excisionase family DNA binding protein